MTTTFNQSGQNVQGEQVNVGSVEGGVQQIGRSQSGGISFEGSTSVSGDVVGRDSNQYPGDFRGAILNINATLSGVSQTITNSPKGSDAQKMTLQGLIAQLHDLLVQTPEELSAESQRLVERVETLVEEGAEDEPSIDIVETLGKRLQASAQKLAVALPPALTLTRQIVETVRLILG